MNDFVDLKGIIVVLYEYVHYNKFLRINQTNLLNLVMNYILCVANTDF